jgi:hypothetical protein
MALFAGSRSKRRGRVAGVFAAAMLLAMPMVASAQTQAAASLSPAQASTAVRKLLHKATQAAFDTLSQPDGYWSSTVARIPLPTLFAEKSARKGVLESDDFRIQLQHRLNQFAEAGAKAAALRAPGAIDKVKIVDPAAVLAGSATAATSAVRAEAGPRLINAVIPAIYKAIHQARDPLVAQAIASLKGVDERDVARALANEADNATWFQIGAEEAAIRRSPDAGGDPALAAALGKS